MTTPAFEGWFVVRDDLLPERWRERAAPAQVVPLLASELQQVLGEVDAQAPGVDEQLARLVAEGATDREIAQELALSMRSVQRRIARLRQRFAVASKGELRRVLSEMGFAETADPASD